MQKLNGRARGPGRLAAGPVVVVAIALVMLIGDLGSGTGSTDALPQAPARRTSTPTTATAHEKVRALASGARVATVVPATTPSDVRVRAAGAPKAASDAKGSDATTLVPAPHEVAAKPSARVTTRHTRAPKPSRRPSRLLYWGASIGSQLTGDQAPWDMNAVDDFERMAGKGMSILNWGDMFFSPQSCGGYCNFDPTLFDRVRDHGSIPFVSWASAPATGAFTDAAIAAGAQDAYLRRWAMAAKRWGHPFFLRLDWEMNGSWFGWGVGTNGNTAADYVAMWRHVHRVFESVGATNVTWVWCPNVDLDHLAPLASLYPGDEYVDWVGLDGYNWGTNPAGHRGGWETFESVYRSTYDTIVKWIAPGKPMIVSEVGSTERGGSKAAWITDMLGAQLLKKFPKVAGVLWFDRGGAEADGMDWPIESSRAATRAFASAIQKRAYTTNAYASLAGPKVAPPHT